MEPKKPTLTNLEKYVGSSRQNIKQLASSSRKRDSGHKQDPEDARSLLLEITDSAKEFFSAEITILWNFLNRLSAIFPKKT
jgi:hypothetical protein